MLNQRNKMTHYVTYDHDYDSSTTVTNYRWNVAFATLSLTLSTGLIIIYHHIAVHPHRWKPSSYSVTFSEGEDHQRHYIQTYINLIPGLWMDVSSVTSVYQSPCCRLHSPHPTFRILRGHSQGSAHCAPVTVMSSPGSLVAVRWWNDVVIQWSLLMFNCCSPTPCSAVEQHGTFTANFGILHWYESLKYWK